MEKGRKRFNVNGACISKNLTIRSRNSRICLQQKWPNLGGDNHPAVLSNSSITKCVECSFVYPTVNKILV